MMPMNEKTDYKEVDFKKYCPLCKYSDLNGFENPCDDCLTWPYLWVLVLAMLRMKNDSRKKHLTL